MCSPMILTSRLKGYSWGWMVGLWGECGNVCCLFSPPLCILISDSVTRDCDVHNVISMHCNLGECAGCKHAVYTGWDEITQQSRKTEEIKKKLILLRKLLFLH